MTKIRVNYVGYHSVLQFSETLSKINTLFASAYDYTAINELIHQLNNKTEIMAYIFAEINQ